MMGLMGFTDNSVLDILTHKILAADILVHQFEKCPVEPYMAFGR